MEYTFSNGLSLICAAAGKPCPDATVGRGKYRWCKSVFADGREYPLFSYRNFPKFATMKNLPVLGRRCALTVLSVGADPLPEILFRELDLAEYLLGAKIREVALCRRGTSANAIANFENHTTAHLTLHSAGFGERQFRHELFTKEGMVSDRVVDTVVAQHALNIFTADGYESFTDADFTLYGFDPLTQEELYCAYDTLFGDTDEICARAERIEAIVSALIGQTEGDFAVWKKGDDDGTV